jgi:hypothetical protein
VTVTAKATATATAEQLRHIVEAAGLAPSVHNTQPWRFVATPTGLELYADPQRQLAVLDPDGRQLHLSCGAALLHARIAARALGLGVAVRLLPDAAVPTHLADLRVTQGGPATDDEVRLATAILRRHTHRGAFADRRLPEAFMEMLRIAAESEGACVRRVVDEQELVELEVLLARADAAEEHDERYAGELRRWVYEGGARSDGIPIAVLDAVPGSSLRQRDFVLARPPGVDGTVPPAEHPEVVVLSTDDDDPRAWLRAGQALAAILLRAADHGVQAQPLGQVTDTVGYRLGLRSALGLVGVPQLVLRMGYATRTTVTPRRPVDDVLAVADSGA